MSHESRPLAIRARYQSESAGYLRLSFSKALHSAISIPHACDHSVQLGPVVGEEGGGDTSLPLGRCSAIDTYSTSVATASSKLSDGRLEGVSVLEVAEEPGQLSPLHAVVAAIEVVAGGGEGIRDAIKLSGEPRALLVELSVSEYLRHSGGVVETAGFLGEGVETSIPTGEEGEEPRSCCLSGGLSIVRPEEKVCDIGGFPRLPPSQ
jgi:hypothetical protein